MAALPATPLRCSSLSVVTGGSTFGATHRLPLGKRYLSSISLALIMLMALACTATPATPAPTTSTAFSCQELADTLAATQTETAAQVFISAWEESGCAEKAVR